MNIAKASPADIDMLTELTAALDALTQRYGATMPEAIAKPDHEDGVEFFNEENTEQCQRALQHLLQIANKGSMFRAALNLSTLLNPANKCIDHSQSHLEHYPLIQHEEAIVAALKFYADAKNHGFGREIQTDRGTKAREALALFHKEPEATPV